MGEFVWVIDIVARETVLFAAVGLLLGGIDDLLIDVVYLARQARRGRTSMTSVRDMSAGAGERMAILIPAWDESGVIGAMLTTMATRFGDAPYRVFVGTYPNDRATIDAVAAVAENDARIRLVIGDEPGPTTKAQCLNTVWRALSREAEAIDVILLHDAEDVVHPDELTVIGDMIRRHDVVQLPVLPLVKRNSRFVSGHYADEFAESHSKTMPVRLALRAGMPLAGTGCAIRTAMLARIAADRGGAPFDATSLTEDYELGLRIAELGGRGVFARVTGRDGRLVAVRAYFPATFGAAVRQKTRWMTGIALAGWDRTGWARPLALTDHWMRLRDRRAPLAVLVLATAYVALIAWGLSMLAHWEDGGGLVDVSATFLIVNATLLAWRIGTRALFTGRHYGWRQAVLSVPRFVVGNAIALVAAPRAMTQYVGILLGRAPRWDKTRHDFPDAWEVDAL